MRGGEGTRPPPPAPSTVPTRPRLDREDALGWQPHTLHPTACTLHPAPCIPAPLHPCILHPCILHPTPCTLPAVPCTPSPRAGCARFPPKDGKLGRLPVRYRGLCPACSSLPAASPRPRAVSQSCFPPSETDHISYH